MTRKKIHFCGITLLLPLLLLSGVTRAVASPITAEMRREDVRLEKPVNVTAYRMYTGELLEMLSRQTGVTLIANEKDGASDDRVSVAFQNLPLADALNAVRSLFSYQNATYRWVQEADANPASKTCAYRLVRGDNARNFAANTSLRLQQELIDELNAKIALLNKSPEQRRKAGEADPVMKMDGRYEGALRATAALLTPEQIAQAVRTGDEVSVPAAKFGSVGRDFVASEQTLFTKNNPHLRWNPPTNFVFKREIEDGGILPTFSIVSEHDESDSPVRPGQLKIGQVRDFYGVAGGYQQQRQKEWDKRTQSWRLGPDENIAPALANVPTTTASDNDKEDASAQFRRLKALSRNAKISIIARLPLTQPESGELSPAAGPAEWVKKLNAAGLDVKWSGKVTAVTYQTWLTVEKEEARVPWSVVKRFREICAKSPQHVLSFGDLCDAAALLTPAQRRALYEAPPFTTMWRFDIWNDMRQVDQLLPLFSAFRRSPSLFADAQTKTGVALNAFPIAARKFLDDQPVRGSRLHIWPRSYTDRPDRAPYLQLDITDATGATVSTSNVQFSPWLPPVRETSVVSNTVYGGAPSAVTPVAHP